MVDDALALVANTVTWRREKKVQHIAENDPYKILGCAEDELLFFYREYLPCGAMLSDHDCRAGGERRLGFPS